MGPNKSLDEVKIIAAMLHDVWLQHGVVFNLSSYRKTLKKVLRRYDREGIGFLTKTLPRLGKALDKAFAGIRLTAANHGFKTMKGSELPIFLGEFISRILGPDGALLPNPCENSVKVVRQILYSFYKYEVPYSADQELSVIEKFERTDHNLQAVNERASALYRDTVDNKDWPSPATRRGTRRQTLHRARILLARLFARFDPKDVKPRNGPGAVAGKQRQWDKFRFINVSANITSIYPRDAFYCASMGHVCDEYKNFSSSWTEEDLPARVILVPKDSRGPRLISAEPADYQWIQQGLGRAIVGLVERHPLTKWNVFFTDQTPNQRGALLGSSSGRYATLDLNEASDRVSVGLVRLLFPSNVFECLMACRSSATELPDGRVIRLNKFAPMGSSLCFPVMALTVWAILTAAAPNADARKSILVYGDDVIVPTAQAADAIEQLESAGLKVNHDKSCTSGLFRESCGTDSFNGVNVTPVRFRTVWSPSRSPEVYSSFIAYANELYDRQYFTTYDYIVEELLRVYGAIPGEDMHLACPSLRDVPADQRPRRRRSNLRLQKQEFYVWDVQSPHTRRLLPGWLMLLRFFTEGNIKHPNRIQQRVWDRVVGGPLQVAHPGTPQGVLGPAQLPDTCSAATRAYFETMFREWLAEHFATDPLMLLGQTTTAGGDREVPLLVGEYTQRNTSKLVRRWR